MTTTPPITHPFLPGTKVARICRSRNGYGQGTGTVERSVVASLISKGKRAGRFTVHGWDGEHQATRNEDGSWIAKGINWYRGRVFLDDGSVAEIERGFRNADLLLTIDRHQSEISRLIGDAKCSIPADDRQVLIDHLRGVVDSLKAFDAKR